VDLTLLVVSNGQYFGAGMHACPHASINDGKLAYVLMEGMKKSHVVHALARSFKGKHLRLRNVGHGHASRIELFLPPGSDAEVLLELDGEQPGRAPVSFRAVPSGIRLLVA
jgi:diacylglycerol kinase family enzyme